MRPQRRFLAWTLLAFVACSTTFAAEPEKPARPYLWKIEGAGKKPSWLFGTIHLQRPAVTKLPPSVTAAIGSADVINTEIPMDIPTIAGLMPKMALPEGKTLTKLLGKGLIADVEAEFAAVNPSLSVAAFDSFKPWAVAGLLIEMEDQVKYPTSLPVDMLIYQRAAMAGKEVGGIETPDEQFAIFDGLTEAEQVAMVKDTVRQMREFRAKGQSLTDLLTSLYLEGDLDKLVDELNKLDASEDPKFTEKFIESVLYQRNTRMAERIEKRLREHPDKSYFIAVGAAHLQGDRGLIALLGKAGFKLTRVE